MLKALSQLNFNTCTPKSQQLVFIVKTTNWRVSSGVRPPRANPMEPSQAFIRTTQKRTHKGCVRVSTVMKGACRFHFVEPRQRKCKHFPNPMEPSQALIRTTQKRTHKGCVRVYCMSYSEPLRFPTTDLNPAAKFYLRRVMILYNSP